MPSYFSPTALKQSVHSLTEVTPKIHPKHHGESLSLSLSPTDAFQIHRAAPSAKRPPAGVRGGRRRRLSGTGHAGGELALWWRHPETQPPEHLPLTHHPTGLSPRRHQGQRGARRQR